MNETHEQWRPIPGYEGFYEASDLGRIRSAARGRVLTPTLYRGRLKVSLSVGGVRRYIAVSRLVGEAWLGAPPAGHRIAHVSDDLTDNRRANLAIMSTHEVGARTGQRNRGKTLDMCRRGLHPMSGPNLQINPCGSRQCRSCREAAAREWRRRNREGRGNQASISRAAAN